MLSLMALLDRKRTSDLKLLRHFDYPLELSKVVFEHEILQTFKECGEENLQLLRRVHYVVPKEFVKYFEANKPDETHEYIDE